MAQKQNRFGLSIPVLFVFLASPSWAQDFEGCERSEVAEPTRSLYVCDNGLAFESEAAAKFLMTSNKDQVDLDKGATLIDLPPDFGSFQVRTPHAVASVRGTEYIVDVHEATTSVFVISGRVWVSHTEGSETVELRAGDGVDVFENSPLTVRQWSTERATALLARFAR